MLHSGVCMVRQYCAFAGMVYGQTARDFFARLTAHRIRDGVRLRSQARPDLPHPPPRAVPGDRRASQPPQEARDLGPRHRASDAAGCRSGRVHDLRWLATEREKVEHFSLPWGASSGARSSHVSCSATSSTAPSDTSLTGCRSARSRWPGTRVSVSGHAERAGRLQGIPPAARGTAASAAVLDHPARWCRRIWRQPARRSQPPADRNCASPLRPSVVDELRWFFAEQRRLATADDDLRSEDPDRFARLRRGFSAPRYRRLYRAWTADGDRALGALCSPVLADAIDAADGANRVRAAGSPVPSSLSPGRHGMTRRQPADGGATALRANGSPGVKVTGLRVTVAGHR